MKKIIISAVFLACLATTAIAQIPDNIQSYFQYKYPGVRIQMIERIDNGYVGYVASFSKEGENGAAYFDEYGRWLRTEVNFSGKSVPDAIKVSLENGKYNGYTVEKAKLIETPASQVFTVSVNADTITNQDQYVYCTSTGNCWDK